MTHQSWRAATATACAVLLAAVALLVSTRFSAGSAAAMRIAGSVAVPDAGTVSDPQVTGPIGADGSGRPVTASPVPLGPAGYQEQEYVLAGTATGYTQAGTWDSDGRWSVQPGARAPYRTRMLVRRPADPARFNGTVVVEWLDLPGGVDTDPDFLYEHDELLRAGYAWVGVTTQQQAVSTLRGTDPARYGTLDHPGDTFSYSIFSEAARSLRHPYGVDPLGGLRPAVFIADGYSGSAARMVTYANAIQPVDNLFSGILIHSRWARSNPISQAPQPQQPSPPVVHTRTDLAVPVLTVETESEILGGMVYHPTLDYYPARQADSDNFRLWEVPGTAHVDADLARLLDQETGTPGAPCDPPANNGQESSVMDAALAQLNRWVRTGVAAPTVPRIQTTAGTDPTIARDGYGNALGGLRTPALGAPIATLTGVGSSTGGPQCELQGTTVPFTPDRLASRYPTHAAYVAAVTRAVGVDVKAGYLLADDGTRIVRAAIRAPIPVAR